MRRRHLVGVLLGLVILAALLTPWPKMVFWMLAIWLACPGYNPLSPSCGPFTLMFVADRAMAILLFGYVAWLMWQIFRPTKK